MIASTFPARSGQRVKKPNPVTMEDWKAYEGDFVRGMGNAGYNGGYVGCLLQEVISETEARVLFAGHKKPEIVALNRIKPWVKGSAVQEAHRSARTEKPVQDPEEDTYIYSRETNGFLGGIRQGRGDPSSFSYELGQVNCFRDVKDATHGPRSWVLENLPRIRKAYPDLRDLELLNAEAAHERWAEVVEQNGTPMDMVDGERLRLQEARAERLAKAVRKEAERIAKEARWAKERAEQAAKVEATKRAAEAAKVEEAKALLAKLGEPELLTVPQPVPAAQQVVTGPPSPVLVPEKPIAAILAEAAPSPLPLQRAVPESAPALAPVAAAPIPAPAPQASGLEKAKAARRAALRDIATAKAMVREAEGRLEQAETEIRIEEEG